MMGARLGWAEPGARAALPSAVERARTGLAEAAAAATAEGMPRLALSGQLIRPVAALAGAGAGELPRGFWEAALAVQMAHEASLVHDDIVDAAATRRGERTLFSERGVGAALVHGDHLLTAAYRVAARTGSLEFASRFARAVERTVAGEIQQGRSAGRTLDWAAYEQIALGKAGELLGCALAAAPVLRGRADAEEMYELGRSLGVLYQMLDDLLDYCPATDTGKPALGDYAQGRWTWPLLVAAEVRLGGDPGEAAARLRAAGSGGSALRACLRRLERDVAALRLRARRLLGTDELLAELLEGWLARAAEAVAAEERAGTDPSAARPARPSAALRARVPETAAVPGYLARNSRSFRFAARFFPAADAERVARVYAFCRVTDDLVDRPAEGAAREALLEEWVDLARRAYDGTPSGIGFLDRAMQEMGERRVPFRYAAELVEGMRMDLRGERYETPAELRRYTYRVASVVGLWLTELSGVRAPLVLERAAALGHAMQLTNILRDVGEDARAGRIYLPAELMRRHGVAEGEVREWSAGRGVPGEGYRALVREMLAEAEASYRLAFEAIPCLPRAFRRPVAVAAYVYRGIHAAIRRNGYDNLSRRAVTSPAAKGVLAVRALWELRALERRGLPEALAGEVGAAGAERGLHMVPAMGPGPRG